MKQKVVVAIVVISVLIVGVVAALVFLGKDETVVMEKYVETTNAVYDISINMDRENDFQVHTAIDVTNDSTDAWADIGFYLVPNAMNAEETKSYEDDRAQIEVTSITVDGKEVSYTLENNKLLVELETPLESGSLANVVVDYSMTLPQNGMRLSQVDD
ncbi:MAG: peptidase, partial [Planococcus donghaensis]